MVSDRRDPAPLPAGLDIPAEDRKQTLLHVRLGNSAITPYERRANVPHSEGTPLCERLQTYRL